jgi:hypothetical protein
VVLGTRRQTARTTLAASAALAATVVPVFLAGALSGPMGEELGFGPGAAGLAITGFFVAAGLAAVPMARLTPRLGVRAAMRTGIVVSGVGCLLLATVARSWWHLAALLLLVGSVVGLVDTAAAGAFAGTIRRARQGLAFGVKEASVPIASMVAGVSVPLAAAWWGWRAAFASVALLFPLAWALVPADRTVPRGGSGEHDGVNAGEGPRPTGGTSGAGPRTDLVGDLDAQAGARSLAPVRALAVGIAAGAGAANAAATLLVPTATAGGLSAPAAGVLLAVASVTSVVVRVGAGWAADRSARSPVTWVAGALALGAAGTAILAIGVHPVAVTAGAMLTLGAGWGWTGLAFLAAIRLAPTVPARAAGTVLTGLAIGGALGPSAFAALSARGGASAAWSAAAVAFVVGAAVTAAAGRRAPR